LITDAFGEPLAATLTGANAHYLTQQPPLVVAIAQVGGRAVRPAPIRCEGSLTAPLTRPLQQASAERCVKSWLARRRLSHLIGLVALRWVVERTIAWLHQLLRLRLRYEKRADIDEVVPAMSCCLICF
jgi:transposase